MLYYTEGGSDSSLAEITEAGMQQYDRHNPIIKWYQYDARKLYQTAEAEEVVREEAGPPSPDGVTDMPPADTAGPTGDPAMDDEVARIMAQFSEAKQNNVDDVFAMMAAEADGAEQDNPGGGSSPSEEDDQEALLASLLKPKQSTVDDLVAKAREGN